MIHQDELNALSELPRHYISLAVDLPLKDALQQTLDQAETCLATIPEAKGTHRYAEGKWSIKEVVCHMIDSERIFAYRALRFARHDTTPLPGFEENEYTPHTNADARTLERLTVEMRRLRLSTQDLFNSFTPEMLLQKGVASGLTMSVEMIGYIIAGHMRHHIHIIKERYITH